MTCRCTLLLHKEGIDLRAHPYPLQEDADLYRNVALTTLGRTNSCNSCSTWCGTKRPSMSSYLAKKPLNATARPAKAFAVRPKRNIGKSVLKLLCRRSQLPYETYSTPRVDARCLARPCVRSGHLVMRLFSHICWAYRPDRLLCCFASIRLPSVVIRIPHDDHI